MGDVVRVQESPGERALRLSPNGSGGTLMRADVAALIGTDGIVHQSRDVSPVVPEVIRIFKANLPTPIARALAKLADAAVDGTPCHSDAEAFDLPESLPPFGSRGFYRAVSILKDAADQCIECPVFVQCSAVAEANRAERRPVITGVLAGELHGAKDAVVQAMDELQRGIERSA